MARLGDPVHALSAAFRISPENRDAGSGLRQAFGQSPAKNAGRSDYHRDFT
jgi:hypothetical protein